MVTALLVMLAIPYGKAWGAASSVRIHVLTFSNYQDAIIIESDGRFGIVDSGEDDDSPDGSDPRYPVRKGTTIGQGHVDEVIAYLQGLGATADNVEFYIGTHAHSDHVGSADEVIRTFLPDRVYVPDYQDDYITDASHLWDNLYVFDHMEAAAQEVGAAFITNLSYDAPVYPSDGGAGYPSFSLGSAEITIMNWQGHALSSGAYADANDYCWGVRVSCGGKTAFLAGDINNYGGDEDVLASELGHVDMLKLGHHGGTGSNTSAYLTALSPSYAVLTGPFSHMPTATVDTLLSLGTHVYVASESAKQGKSAIVITLSGDGIAADALANPSAMTFRVGCGSHDVVAFVDGAPAPYAGDWTSSSGRTYHFDGSPYGRTTETPDESTSGAWKHNARGWWWRNADGTYPTNCWMSIGGKWYYFDTSGYMKTGWLKDGGNWYYLDTSGAMATGWKKVKGVWYYLDDSRGGAMVTGFFTVGSTRYLAKANGTCPVSAWISQGSLWYLTDSSCAVRTGWAQVGKTWYYLDPKKDDAMATGWTKVKGVWYYLNSSGSMQTGWKKLDGSWYWFKASGAMQTGWAKIGSSWYWFDDTGKMLASGWTPDGCYVNAQGAWVKGKTR